MLGTLGNTRKIEVIPSYARKNKSAHGLPRQDLPDMIKVSYRLITPRFKRFCVSVSNLPKIYQYFWRARLAKKMSQNEEIKT